MRNVLLDLSTFGLAGATRVAIGAGLGLLLADCCIRPQRRRTIGAGLIVAGAAMTSPAVRVVLRRATKTELVRIG